jgi:hypothetical protein
VRPRDHILRSVHGTKESSSSDQRRQGNAPTKTDLEYTVRRLQIEQSDREGVHRCIVTIHHPRHETTHESRRARKLSSNDSRWHYLSPLTSMRLMLAISCGALFVDIRRRP